MSVRPSAGVWGTTFAIGGTLTCFGSPVAAAPVQVQRRIAGTFTFETVANLSTATDGSYATTAKPDRSADYRAIVQGGTGECNLSTTPSVRGDVRVGIASNVVAARVRAGSQGTIKGKVVPPHAGKKVYLQVFQGSQHRWANASVAALDRSSLYTVSYRKTSPGYLLLRVVYPTQDADHAWNVGRTVRIDWY